MLECILVSLKFYVHICLLLMAIRKVEAGFGRLLEGGSDIGWIRRDF